MNLKERLFTIRQYVRVPVEIVRDGRLWVNQGRYQLVRKLEDKRFLIRTGANELTIVKEGEAYLE